MMRICDALAIPRGVIAVVGGGGKTSLIYRLAKELSMRGRVLCLTTTRIRVPAGGYLRSPSRDELEAAFGNSRIVTIGEPEPDNKLSAPSTDVMALADYTLVEADGSRGLPVKAPNEHEPVFTGREALVIAVAGMSAVGKSIAEAAHRPERFASLVGKPMDALIEPSDIAFALTHAQGQRKDVTTRFALLLNQCDDSPRLKAARECAKRATEDCVLTALLTKPDFLEIWRNGRC